jgi:outer membrane protein assembly factor BamB
MRENGEGRNAGLLKVLLIGIFTAIAVFFIVQVLAGASSGSGAAASDGSPDERGSAGDISLYRSFTDILGDMADVRIYQLLPSWELAINGDVFISEEQGSLYLTSTQGQVIALDAASGRIRWSLDLGVWVSAPPAVEEGVVYVGATNHVLYALDAGSGVLLWYYPSQGEILASPVVSDGMVYFCADNDSVFDLVHRLYALDARSGTPLWIYDTDSWTPSAPAVGEDAVYLGGYQREVNALDKYAGEELWSFTASNIVFSSPQTAENMVLFTSINGWVHALDAASGKPVWSRQLAGFVWLAPSNGDGNLYVCSRDNIMSALALETGDLLWTYEGEDFLSCSPLSRGEQVCAFDAQGQVCILDSASGEQVGLLLAPYDFTAQPLIEGGMLYARSSDGLVRAYPLPEDELLRSRE